MSALLCEESAVFIDESTETELSFEEAWQFVKNKDISRNIVEQNSLDTHYYEFEDNIKVKPIYKQ